LATKLQLITEMSEHVTKKLSGTHDYWTAFLRTAAWNYKYSFAEQVLIHAQRPGATACAPIELWNERFNRWVKKGSQGIALIDDSGSKLRLRYVFDISDTNSQGGMPVYIWSRENRYDDAVIEALEGIFGALENKDSLADALISAAENAVEDNFTDYYSELMKIRDDSFLEELDELNVEVELKRVLSSSVAYMLLTRCGINTNRYFEPADFVHVFDFNTLPTVSLLGNAVSDIAEMALREIGDTIRNLHIQERETRKFAKPKNIVQNGNREAKTERSDEHGADVHEEGRLSSARPGVTGAAAHREIWDAAKIVSQKPQKSDIHEPFTIREADGASGGDRSDGTRTDRTDNRRDGEGSRRKRIDESFRADEVDGPDEQPEALSGGDDTGGADLQLEWHDRRTEDRSLPFFHDDDVIKEILRSIPHIKASKQEIAEFYSMHEDRDEQAAYIRSIFNNDYTELLVGENHRIGYKTYQNVLHLWEGEYLSRTSQGYYDWGVIAGYYESMILFNELLDEPALPAEEQQIAFIEQAESEKASAFFMPQEAIDTILQRGSGMQDGKLRIYQQFQRYASIKENAEFLKNEYGTGGHGPALTGTDIQEWHDSKGIRLTSNRYIEPDADIMLGWPKVAKRIGELIAADRYLTGKEKQHLPSFESGLAERIQRLTEENEARAVLSHVPEPLRENAEYSFSLGNTVYLGVDEYEILSIDSNRVLLFDAAFPLFNKEMDREEFERKVRENPANDNLIAHTEPLRALPEDTLISDEVADELEPQETEEQLAPAWEKHGERIVRAEADLLPETPQTERRNFRITNDALGYGGQKTKYAYNLEAIRLLKRLEDEKRFANAEEQEILSLYVGWGGIPQAFDENNTSWTKEYAELKALLTEDEYISARESTLSAHYTCPTVIRAIYAAIENMGFKSGNVLEPACGIGNFFGLVPESMKDSKFYGVELDSISGRIAKQLYQKNSITIQGFETADMPDSFFDMAIGNVPFGAFGVADKRYEKHKFHIHDYFFAKTLDKVRSGGIVAFITSKGTMDKQNAEVRKYIAQRAELLGAIRLPNNAFLANAGTEVTADILFLQKRDRVVNDEPNWVHLAKTEDGIPVNQYFADNPDMLLGTMTYENTMYGNASDTTCRPYEGADLSEQLRDAISNIHAEITEYVLDDLAGKEEASIPADPSVRNFSYTIVDGKIYFRENSRMNPIETSATAENRIKGMIEIRDCVRMLIEYQTEDYSDEDIGREQARLNRLYDRFTSKYGLLSNRGNNMAFSDDSSYCLLCSLEILNEDGELERKADMFTRRTIRRRSAVTRVDTASEALAVSMAERACVDMGVMQNLTGLSADELEKQLTGIVFRIPEPKDSSDDPHYVTADEYLSGNVREKLRIARMAAEISDMFTANVKALEAVQPANLTASEISVRLGATWLPPEIVEEFMYELLGTAWFDRKAIRVHYSPYTAEWNIEGKSRDRSSVKAFTTYGTERINAYKIIEETLNLRDVRIFDTKYDENGNKTYVLNRKETAIAQAKQEVIKNEFSEWIWRDHDRREKLCRLYNDKFNATRPREYDGSHIHFVGMNPEITLRPHQVNAIAHVLYGGNTLLAHVVGAGKTFEMVAAAMESKRLGLCQKSLFVVPNHLTEQWSAEFLQLYPSANILVATKKDFETKNRKKFCGRIATGDYDAVIIGHSQFEKIPMSIERQKSTLQEQLDEIAAAVAELKSNRGENYSIKQLEKTKKSVKLKLDKLNDQSRKDVVVTFEELGVDRLFVDESHFYKNLFLYTKMRNVGGIAQTEAQKSSDLFMKCRYLDELTGGRGIVFATGTPISNSMVELYTVQRYLQYETLRRSGLQHFDAWASTFGETVTAIELAPEGTGYRAKTRFAKFYNLPELMAMFKEVADIQTADMLNLPVPKANYHNVALKPSELQKEMVAELSERADRVRNKMVEPTEDNMLLITNDGRKLALDQRLINPMLPDNENSKASMCAGNVFKLWEANRDKRLTQLVFCDLSTPHYDDSFNVYDDIRQKLVDKGIPAEEIAFIHDANTETKKAELFAKVRCGKVRVLLGSTFKMGAGTNVQDLLVALHDLDCPWRPSDLEQRSGRIVRQGNKNPEVDIFRYVTENTFDAYLYQLVENKQRFIGQIMTSKSPVRSAEDIDETALSYAEIKALATGNPYIKEKMDLDIAVSKLKLLKSSHLSQKYALEDQIVKSFPAQIRKLEEMIEGYKADIEKVQNTTLKSDADEAKFSPMTVMEQTCVLKEDAGKAILEACKKMTSPEPVIIGSYRGFELSLSFDTFSKEYKLTLKNTLSHSISLSTDTYGNITRMDNALEGLPAKLQASEQLLENTRQQLETAKLEVQRPFAQEEELKTKAARLAELDALLNLEQKDVEIIDEEPDEEVEVGAYRIQTSAR